MDITQIYAIAAGGLLSLLLIAHCLQYVTWAVRYISYFISRYLTNSYLVQRHRFFGPWTRAGILVQAVYVTANIFCLTFQVSKLSQVTLRAGTLCLINMIPLFAGPHLSFIADVLGMSLNTYQRIHRSGSWMSLALGLCHVVITIIREKTLTVGSPRALFGLIGGLSLCLIIVASHPFLRRLSYEIFLRLHQALAICLTYSTWRHLPADRLFPRFYLYICAALFATMLLAQTAVVLYKNGAFGYRSSRAEIVHVDGAIRITIKLSKPLYVKPGQYINIWIPSIGFWSLLQTHPFVVTSWEVEDQDTLELLIQPRRGLTRQLLHHAVQGMNSRLVLFSGPHGKSAPVGNYEDVLMIADGFGIAAHLPYLKRLIYGYNCRNIRTRRIHLVWQVQDIGTAAPFFPLLNQALEDDTLDSGYIFRVSIYHTSGREERSLGRRATLYQGAAQLHEILDTEVRGEPNGAQDGIEKLQGFHSQKGKMLVMVSGTLSQKDTIRGLMQRHLTNGVEMLELDYQPLA